MAGIANSTPGAAPARSDTRLRMFTYAAAAACAAAAGYISATGKPGLIAIFAGLLAGAAVLSNRKALLWFVILGGLVAVGTMQLYVPGSKYVRYIVPLASCVLLLYAAFEHLGKQSVAHSTASSAITRWLFVFLGIAIVSSLINQSSTGVIIMGMKGYFQMWALFFGLIYIRWQKDIIDTLPKGLLVIALVQLPFVLHQYFFLVPKRIGLGGGVVAVDVVAGTFGASMWGGGANAVLAAFMMIVIACVLAIWKNGAMATWKAATISLLCLSPVFVNQAKISAVYLPLLFGVIFYKEILRSPLRFLSAGVAMGLLLAGLLTALTVTQQAGRFDNWQELVKFTIERQTASANERGDEYSELSRITALTFWAEEHLRANPANTLIGHGPGASRVQDGGLDLATTLAETRYSGKPIGYTALSAILWDTGVMGLLAVIAAFLAAFRTAAWLSQHYKYSDPFKAGLYDGLRAAIAILLLSLAHKDFFAFHIPYQSLVMLILGFLIISEQNARRQASA